MLVQSSQNNRFVISLWYIKENVDFWQAVQKFLQMDSITLGVWPGISNLPKITSLIFLCNMLRKKVIEKVYFLHADKHESFLQVDFNTLDIKVSCSVILSLSMAMIKYSQSSESNKLTIYLQYFKKEARDGVPFLREDNYQSFYKLALSFLMELATHVWSKKNRKLVIYLQYLKKKMAQLLLCSITIENIQIFYRDPIIFVATCWSLIFLNS